MGQYDMNVRMIGTEPSETAIFESAEEALQWATEVLRRRRVPKIAAFWRDLMQEADEVADTFEAMVRKLHLPQDADGRFALAMRIYHALSGVEQQDAALARILRLWVWGDWADDDRLRRALRFQEVCRQKGIKVRIAYRYSYEQLGILLGCSKKTAWRRVQDGLARLDVVLRDRGMVMVRKR